jgi:hypothetical protein
MLYSFTPIRSLLSKSKKPAEASFLHKRKKPAKSELHLFKLGNASENQVVQAEKYRNPQQYTKKRHHAFNSAIQ